VTRWTGAPTQPNSKQRITINPPTQLKVEAHLHAKSNQGISPASRQSKSNHKPTYTAIHARSAPLPNSKLLKTVLKPLLHPLFGVRNSVFSGQFTKQKFAGQHPFTQLKKNTLLPGHSNPHKSTYISTYLTHPKNFL
jgi:hypothetical protein